MRSFVLFFFILTFTKSTIPNINTSVIGESKRKGTSTITLEDIIANMLEKLLEHERLFTKIFNCRLIVANWLHIRGMFIDLGFAMSMVRSSNIGNVSVLKLFVSWNLRFSAKGHGDDGNCFKCPTYGVIWFGMVPFSWPTLWREGEQNSSEPGKYTGKEAEMLLGNARFSARGVGNPFGIRLNFVGIAWL